MTSQDENKPGLSWTVLDIERDVTYSLPIFLGVGKNKAINKWMYALCKYDNTQKTIIQGVFFQRDKGMRLLTGVF